MSIHVLSASLASRIAAGEVIERPASVVKELVENSLDAGARRIEVTAESGGLKLIRVVDDGCGIPPAEIAVAFERFATSKIDESSDLSGIRTMGFRGEALPSIASVADVESVSRERGAEAGTRHTVSYGQVGRPQPAGAPSGTSITVRNLFRNVPARLKFMGQPSSELTKINELLAGLALVRPDVAFTLIADGKTRLATPGNGSLRDALATVYDANVAGSMIEVMSDGSSAFSVDGLVSAPEQSRGNRRYITIAVNGRLVQSRRISFAIEQAYHGYLPERRFPVAVIHISAPYEDIDVNVHPAKAEVRFLREGLIYSMVQQAVREALAQQAPVHRVAVRGEREPADGVAQTGAERRLFEDAAWPERRESGPELEQREPQTQSNGAAAESNGSAHPPAAVTHAGVLPVLRVIGQSQDTYIIAEGPDGIFLIDQHAAHERVLYERVVKQFADRNAEVQPLLQPETVELSPSHFAELEAHGEDLAAAGFDVEPFGGRSALLRAVPAMLASPGRSGREALIGLLDGVADGRHSGWWAERMLATIACHSSVRAGQTLSLDESKELIRLLERAEQPRTCPHGRPTMVHLTAGMLEREFGRR
jgi:DNA mismatch repair protein MutL